MDKRNNVLNRVCHHCCDQTYLKDFVELPFFAPIYEDESHVLQSCPRYDDLRSSTTEAIKDHLQTDLKGIFSDDALLPRFGGLITKIFERRFKVDQKG